MAVAVKLLKNQVVLDTGVTEVGRHPSSSQPFTFTALRSARYSFTAG